jgi:hypothetical protein
MRLATRTDIPLSLNITKSLPIPGDVSFVLEEFGNMRELTKTELDAVAGGKPYGPQPSNNILVINGSGNGNFNLGSGNGNGNGAILSSVSVTTQNSLVL